MSSDLNHELRNQYEHLKKINEYPHDYIKERFHELIKEVWLSLSKLDQHVHVRDLQLKQIFQTSYFEMIEEIKLFEQKCLYELMNNREERVVQHESIDLIGTKLNELITVQNESASNELATEISQKIDSIERNIFLNRTIVYLKNVNLNFDKEKNQDSAETNESFVKNRSNRNLLESNKMDETWIGKVVYILNEYFNRKEIQLLKK